MSAQAKSYSWALKAFASLTIIGGLFKLMHWPYYNYLALVAAVILVIFYPLRYIAKKHKEILDHIKVILAILVSVDVIFHLENILYLQLAILALFAYWFFHEGLFYIPIKLDFWNAKENEEDILDDFKEQSKLPPYNYKIDILYALGVILLIIGATFKLLHWPGASYFFIIGASVWSVMIWFKKI